MTEEEINEAVARKLGHTEEELKIWGNDPDYDYCHSIQAVWEIVEKVGRCNLIRGSNDWHFKIITGPLEGVACSADTAPMAICLAFLKLP